MGSDLCLVVGGGGTLVYCSKKGFSPPGHVVFPYRKSPEPPTLNTFLVLSPSVGMLGWSEMVLGFLGLGVWAAGGLGHSFMV